MKTCEYAGEVEGLARSHPWSGSATDETARYLDLRASPALIRTALEDFAPWSRHAAVERFYGLLEWLNGPSSSLESNDCAFSPPARAAGAREETARKAPSSRAFECSGRVMILFRDLARNTSPGEWPAFTLALHRALAVADPSFELGVIGTTLVPVRYRELLGPDSLPREGLQLMLSFWAWGGTERACMTSLARLVENLAAALEQVSEAR